MLPAQSFAANLPRTEYQQQLCRSRSLSLPSSLDILDLRRLSRVGGADMKVDAHNLSPALRKQVHDQEHVVERMS